MGLRCIAERTVSPLNPLVEATFANRNQPTAPVATTIEFAFKFSLSEWHSGGCVLLP